MTKMKLHNGTAAWVTTLGSFALTLSVGCVEEMPAELGVFERAADAQADVLTPPDDATDEREDGAGDADGGADEDGTAPRDDARTDAGDASTEDADAGPPSESEGGTSDARVDYAEQVYEAAVAGFAALEQQNGSQYWYEEENCAPNVQMGRSTVIEVNGAQARVVRQRSFPRGECLANVNRYTTLLPVPLPELFTQCRDLLLNAPVPVTLSVAPNAIIASCYYSMAPNCFDNCGAGYHLRAWGFGPAEAADGGV